MKTTANAAAILALVTARPMTAPQVAAEDAATSKEIAMNSAAAFRAYDTTTEWMGPARETAEAAEADARTHNGGCASQGGYGSAIVVQRDPETPGRCVDMEGRPVWPAHGRSAGTVRWR